ncbi:unnamed protein product [Amoebophrya sp. A120]|nr:unnamed protein product [Amoebophrya sp. A120]|eukprot:GSA120T00003341001.1
MTVDVDAEAEHGCWDAARVTEAAREAEETGATRTVFGYGSLVWKVDFPFVRKFPCFVTGFQRRFWMKSVDHRGTPAFPGRVCTLVKTGSAEDRVAGMAYEISATDFPSVVKNLDFRERHGYTRDITTTEGGTVERRSTIVGEEQNGTSQENRCEGMNLPEEAAPGATSVFVYYFSQEMNSGVTQSRESSDALSSPDLPASSALVRDEAVENTASIIALAVGPSGPNIDYLRQLRTAVRVQLETEDPYLEELLAKAEQFTRDNFEGIHSAGVPVASCSPNERHEIVGTANNAAEDVPVASSNEKPVEQDSRRGTAATEQGQRALQATVDKLFQKCPWSQSIQPRQMLKFLESECAEVRTELDRVEKCDEQVVMEKIETGAVLDSRVETKSQKKEILCCTELEQGSMLSALEEELGDVFFDAMMLAKAIERKFPGVSADRAKARAAEKIRGRCTYLWGTDVAKTPAECEAIYKRRKQEQKEKATKQEAFLLAEV